MNGFSAGEIVVEIHAAVYLYSQYHGVVDVNSTATINSWAVIPSALVCKVTPHHIYATLACSRDDALALPTYRSSSGGNRSGPLKGPCELRTLCSAFVLSSPLNFHALRVCGMLRSGAVCHAATTFYLSKFSFQ